jgi:hypothetical protein
MNGPGKYDDACTAARETTGAAGALLIIFEGEKGHGFSAQLPVEALVQIPTVLREIADQIEEDARALQ